MKTILLSLGLALAVLTAGAQGNMSSAPTAAASVAEVQAGTVKNKFISPYALAGVGVIDTNALAFANRLSISDLGVRDDLVAFFNEFRAAGYSASIWNDFAVFADAFNPTNKLTYRGSAITTTNLTYDWYGANFNGTGEASFAISPATTNHAIVIAWRGNRTDYTQNNYPFLCNLTDTNTPSNNEWIWQSYVQQFFYASSNGVCQPQTYDFNPTRNLIGTPYGQSFLGFQSPDEWVQILSTDGDGTYRVWFNGVPGIFNSSSTFIGGVNTNLNLLKIGYGTTNNFYSLTRISGNGHARCKVMFAGVINGTVTTNMARTIQKAWRNLRAGEVNRLWFGNSRSIPALNTGYNVKQPYSFPEMYDLSPGKSRDYVISMVKSGWKNYQAVSAATNYLIANNLGGKVKKIETFWTDDVNRFYGDAGTSGETAFNDATNFLNSTWCSGHETFVWLTWGCGTNATSPYTYTPAYESNIVVFSHVIDWRYVFNTNTLANTNIFPDGLHQYPETVNTAATNGDFIINRPLANQCLNPLPVMTTRQQ